MACPYLSRRDRTFFLVPASAVVRDHNVQRLSRLPMPTWGDVCPSEIVVLRGRDAGGHTVHTWCVRLTFAVDGGVRTGVDTDEIEQLYSSFLTPLPARVRRDLIRLLEAEAPLRSSALLTRCMDAATAGRLDARGSGWHSVHELAAPRPGTLPEGHPELPWMRRQVRHALQAAEAVTHNSAALALSSSGESESEPPSPLHPASDGGDDAPALPPAKRQRVLSEARALQDLLEEMANKQKGQEGRYLAASGHLKALVDASA